MARILGEQQIRFPVKARELAAQVMARVRVTVRVRELGTAQRPL